MPESISSGSVDHDDHDLKLSTAKSSWQAPVPKPPARQLLRYQPRLSFFRRLSNRLLVFLLFRIARFRIFLIKFFDWRVGLVPKGISIDPQEKILVASSKDGGRRIEVQVHNPPGAVGDSKRLRPPPVHINLHGSGFVIPNMDEDREQCAYLARTLNCTVLDADYCKAPRYKLPEPVHDVVDVIRYVLANPEKYDGERVTLGGVSAGATAALLAAASGDLPRGAVKAVIAWYPCTNLQYRREERVTPPFPKRSTDDGRAVDAFVPGFPLPAWLLDLFMDCAIGEGADLRDPGIAPINIARDRFPPTTLIVGSHDPLYIDAIELYTHLTASPGPNDAELHVVPNATHAFERAGLGVDLTKGEMKEWAVRMGDVWAVVERRLRAVYEGGGASA